jgi:hypothetical protein
MGLTLGPAIFVLRNSRGWPREDVRPIDFFELGNSPISVILRVLRAREGDPVRTAAKAALDQSALKLLEWFYLGIRFRSAGRHCEMERN